MVPALGNFLLWISLCLALIQIVICRQKINNLNLKYSFVINGLLISIFVSFFSLMYCYVVSDFSVLNVFQNSHTTKPLIYKVSAVWGNHEGSMLLWLLVLVIFNYLIFKLIDKKNTKFILKSLETQGFIIIGFLLFTLLTSNPFERIYPPQIDGLGFNPILQDPALVIHPPLLYIGYVGFSAAFSISIATLNLKDDEKIEWYLYMKPFVIAAWTFLTIGIAFGSIWAYYELGWGGWWFWDPVENASLMPWLLGTALLHSLITVEKKHFLKSWVLLLSILAFLLSIIGTFLVRSGILTSVHTLALDHSRGIYILLFTALLGGYSLILFGLKSKNNNRHYYIPFLSKEGSILINNILMTIVCISVLLGTLYPLFIEAFTDNKISVGEPYYNSAVVPIIMPAILIMGIGPILPWGKEDFFKIFRKILPNLILTLLISFCFFLIYKSYSLIGIIGIFLAFWIITNNLVMLYKKKTNYYNGMIVAHLGIGLLILGITGSSIWQDEKISKIKINNEIEINKYRIVFNDIKEIKGPNYVAIEGVFLVYDKQNNVVTKLIPQNRFYPITNSFTTEASIHTNIFRDLYIVLGDGNLKDGWIVRIYHNPLVIWIWIGAFTIFLGGIISMKNNLKKIKKLPI